MAPPKATDEEQLRAVLNNPHSSQCRDFIKFLKAQHCFENLLFWWAVERYKEEWDSLPANANPTALKCQARSLCNTFIVPGSPREVNLEHRVKSQVLQAVEQMEAGNGDSAQYYTLFDSAQAIILRLLSTDVWPRYQKMVNEASHSDGDPKAHVFQACQKYGDLCSLCRHPILVGPMRCTGCSIVAHSNCSNEIVDRNSLFCAQTPQTRGLHARSPSVYEAQPLPPGSSGKVAAVFGAFPAQPPGNAPTKAVSRLYGSDDIPSQPAERTPSFSRPSRFFHLPKTTRPSRLSDGQSAARTLGSRGSFGDLLLPESDRWEWEAEPAHPAFSVPQEPERFASRRSRSCDDVGLLGVTGEGEANAYAAVAPDRGLEGGEGPRADAGGLCAQGPSANEPASPTPLPRPGAGKVIKGAVVGLVSRSPKAMRSVFSPFKPKEQSPTVEHHVPGKACRTLGIFPTRLPSNTAGKAYDVLGTFEASVPPVAPRKAAMILDPRARELERVKTPMSENYSAQQLQDINRLQQRRSLPLITAQGDSVEQATTEAGQQ